MTMEETFRGTKEFEQQVYIWESSVGTLNQLGFLIYNANFKQVRVWHGRSHASIWSQRFTRLSPRWREIWKRSWESLRRFILSQPRRSVKPTSSAKQALSVFWHCVSIGITWRHFLMQWEETTPMYRNFWWYVEDFPLLTLIWTHGFNLR